MRERLTQLLQSLAKSMHVNAAWFALFAGIVGLLWASRHRDWRKSEFPVKVNWYMSVIASAVALLIGLMTLML